MCQALTTPEMPEDYLPMFLDAPESIVDDEKAEPGGLQGLDSARSERGKAGRPTAPRALRVRLFNRTFNEAATRASQTNWTKFGHPRRRPTGPFGCFCKSFWTSNGRSSELPLALLG